MADKEVPQAPAPQGGPDPQNPPAGQNPQSSPPNQNPQNPLPLKILFCQMLLKHQKYHICHH